MKYYYLLLVTICMFFSCENKHNKQKSNHYIKVIDYIPEMVAPGVISKASFEGHASITPSGNEMYFAVYSNDHSYSTIAHSKKINNTWGEPKIATFSGNYSDGSPALSPDGLRLFFSSKRPKRENEINSNNDIWYVERASLNSEWSQPKILDSNVNTEYNEFSPSVDKEGNLYFCSNRPNGFGDMDVYYTKFNGATFDEAILLSQNINSEYHEGNVGVSPDGSLLFIMVQHKPGDYGYDDIHYSINKDGEWSSLINIGSLVNTKTYDFSPKISPDGYTLYFSSRINIDFTQLDSSYTYESFQNQLNSPLNGLGNIYSVELKELNIPADE